MQGLRCSTCRKTRLKTAALCEAQRPVGHRREQKSLTLLFLLPAAGLNIVYVIFFDGFLKLLKFCSLIILFKVFIDIVRHLQVLCFSTYNVAYGAVKTPWRKQFFSSSNQKKSEVFLHVTISRGQDFQHLLYSSFLQDCSSLNHPTAKLQVSGTANCALQTEFTGPRSAPLKPQRKYLILGNIYKELIQS